jgi:hypothetical protein
LYEAEVTDHERNSGTRTALAWAIALVMLLAALSLWTVIPLAWLWIGSQVAESQFPSVGPYAVVFFGALASILVVAWVLGRLNRAYLNLTGSRTVEPIRLGWMRSMRDSTRSRETSLLEAVIVGSVLLACVALGLWFFTLAGSPVA